MLSAESPISLAKCMTRFKLDLRTAAYSNTSEEGNHARATC